jgi:hypothetical protein
MEQITYISTSRHGEPSEADVQSILSASRRNNARDGLGGVLVLGGRRFLQVLEGPTEALDQAYTRIRADPRHFALVELGRKPITTRSFPNWDMGFESDASANLEAVVGRLVEGVADPSLRAQLLSFAQMHRRAA